MQDVIQQYLNPETLVPLGIKWGGAIVTALVVFIIGRWIAKAIAAFLKRMVLKTNGDTTLAAFLSNIVYMALLVAVVIAALGQLGFETTSLLAIFGAAGLAVGLALQGSLSNFAAGVMLIVFRPFKAGDFVEAAGVSGVVEQIRVFNTVMRTGDNIEIIVPNGQILDGIIKNVSARDTRRIDMTIGIGYDDDIDKAESIVNGILAADDRVLEDPAPAVFLMNLGDSSVDLVVRPWVASSDYWAARADLMKRIKVDLEAAGLSIPYPQRDVHVHETGKAA